MFIKKHSPTIISFAKIVHFFEYVVIFLELFFYNSKYFLHANTHSHCVFFDPTLKQGASNVQARKPPQKIPNENVYFCGGFYFSLLI